MFLFFIPRASMALIRAISSVVIDRLGNRWLVQLADQGRCFESRRSAKPKFAPVPPIELLVVRVADIHVTSHVPPAPDFNIPVLIDHAIPFQNFAGANHGRFNR